MSFIVRIFTLTERDINKIIIEQDIKERSDKIKLTKRSLNIRAIIFFIISIGIIGVCWYYVSAFCAVFKNSQGHYFVNWLVAFIVCNIWPCVTSLISTSLRHKALQTGISETLYKISQIVSLI